MHAIDRYWLRVGISIPAKTLVKPGLAAYRVKCVARVGLARCWEECGLGCASICNRWPVDVCLACPCRRAEE